MELKFRTVICLLRVLGSNRTFMELKFIAKFESFVRVDRSNRTFMELKLG